MKNWKTTLTGAALAGLVAWQGCVDHDPKKIIGSVLIAMLGVVAKDFNVTSTTAADGQQKAGQ